MPAPRTMDDGGRKQQHAVFDRSVKAQQRSRAALADDSRAYDYLRAEAATRLVDRLRVRMSRASVQRKSWSAVHAQTLVACRRTCVASSHAFWTSARVTVYSCRILPLASVWRKSYRWSRPKKC